MRAGYAMALSGAAWTALFLVAGFPTLALLCLVGAGACLALARCEVPWWVELLVVGALFGRGQK